MPQIFFHNSPYSQKYVLIGLTLTLGNPVFRYFVTSQTAYCRSVAYWYPKSTDSRSGNQIFRFGYRQYLICKILHGGTLLQPGPNAFKSTKVAKGL